MVDPLTSQGYTQALKERVLDKSLSTCPQCSLAHAVNEDWAESRGLRSILGEQ